MPWFGNVLEETLLPSAARTAASGTAASNEDWNQIEDVRAQLDVTAFTGTSLTGFIESTIDGTNYDVIGTFTAKTAVGREVITINNFVGRNLRFRWAFTGTTATFSVRLVGEK